MENIICKLSSKSSGPLPINSFSAFTPQIEKSVQFSQTYAIYNYDVVQRGQEKSYTRLRQAVDAYLYEKKEAKHEKQLSGETAKGRNERKELKRQAKIR